MAIPGVTLTGTILGLQGSGVAGTVRLALVNLGSALPTVSGTCILVPLIVVIQAASDGTFSQAIWGNYQLSAPSSFYQISVVAANGSSGRASSYRFNTAGSFDLSALSPL